MLSTVILEDALFIGDSLEGGEAVFDNDNLELVRFVVIFSEGLNNLHIDARQLSDSTVDRLNIMIEDAINQ